jgi:plasmid maintenance system antidote protein VapI
MNRRRQIVAHTAAELAQALDLSPRDAIEFEVHAELNDQIIRIVHGLGLTHAQVAKAAGTSRSRITAIMNGNTQEVSTDLMLRILASLGYRARITVTRTKRAA